MTWLQAGDAAKAREHAQACFAIVDANKGPALERFFVHEATCLVERASGDAVAGSQALARARDAFEALSESDKEWCAETMRKLSA